MSRALVVDGANVVGSRPDGWWRDRPAAAQRLWRDLRGSALDHEVVVLVLEGVARRGVDATDAQGAGARVRVVHATGSGDDAVVCQVRSLRSAGFEVMVVTADRGLRERVELEGGSIAGPSWLLGLL